MYEVPSQFGRLCVTESDEGRRSLWFGHGRVCQGVIELGGGACVGLPYVAVALAAMTIAPVLDRVLVIGLGAGMIPRFVHAHLPDTRIDVVEIDPVVVEVASRFFALEPDARLQVHVDDGRRYLDRCEARYDAIVLDGYGLHEVPSHLSTREFLALVRRALAPQGVVVANVWGDVSQRHHACTLATYRDGFAQVHVLDVATLANKIVLARADAGALTREQLVARARAFSAAHRLPLELADHVYAVRGVDELGADLRILHDGEGELFAGSR